MIASLECPHCGGVVEFELEQRGQKADCPHCNVEILLDSPAASQASAEADVARLMAKAEKRRIRSERRAAFMARLGEFMEGVEQFIKAMLLLGAILLGVGLVLFEFGLIDVVKIGLIFGVIWGVLVYRRLGRILAALDRNK